MGHGSFAFSLTFFFSVFQHYYRFFSPFFSLSVYLSNRSLIVPDNTHAMGRRYLLFSFWCLFPPLDRRITVFFFFSHHFTFSSTHSVGIGWIGMITVVQRWRVCVSSVRKLREWLSPFSARPSSTLSLLPIQTDPCYQKQIHAKHRNKTNKKYG